MPDAAHAAASDAPFRIGLVGASGYAGQVLARLITAHPHLSAVLPQARSASDVSADELATLAACDAVALALPAEPARAWCAALEGAGARRVLDLSDAHRRTAGVHYGLPELFGAPPADARLVANPGCYPTATLLALAPLLQAGLVQHQHLAVVGASGTSGAGKTLASHLHFSELHDNLFPYKVGAHRHTPEIEHHLGAPVSFVTELLPVVRGILVTAFVAPKASPATLLDALVARYRDTPFVTVLPAPDQALGLRHVVGSHQAVLAVGPVERSGLVPVFAAIDNLMRGAASQAVANLNLWLGLPEAAGLPDPLPLPAGVPGMKATWQ